MDSSYEAALRSLVIAAYRFAETSPAALKRGGRWDRMERDGRQVREWIELKLNHIEKGGGEGSTRQLSYQCILTSSSTRQLVIQRAD